MVCNLSISQAGLHVQVSAASDRFDNAAAGRLSASFIKTLIQQMKDVDMPSIASGMALQKAGSTGTTERLDSNDGLTPEDQALYQTVLDAVHDVLRIAEDKGSSPGVDAHTNLFRVGLDSILAIRLSSKLRRTDVALTVNEIMQGKTVAAMVAHKCQTAAKKDKQSALIGQAQDFASPLNRDQQLAVTAELGWEPDEVESVLPCLAGQEHHLEYWMFAGRRFFEAPWIYKLRLPVSVSDVQRAWDALRRRHAILRSTFVAHEVHEKSQPSVVQVTRTAHYVDGASDGTFTVLYHSGSATLDDMIEQHLLETNDKSSDLRSPPVQMTLVQTCSDEAAIIMRFHHAMYDAWSIRMLLRELDQLVQSDRPLHKPVEFAGAVKDIFGQRNLHNEHVFWSQALGSAQTSILSPSEKADNAHTGPLGPQHLVRLPSVISAATLRSLETLSQTKANSSLSPAILFAFAQAVAENLDAPCSSPTFGFYHASRSLGSLDLTQVVMPTLTLTPLSVQVGSMEDSNNDSAAATAVIDAIQGVQNYLSQLSQHGQASMHDILKHINRPDEERPLFNSYINLLYRDSSSSSSSSEEEEKATATAPLTVLEKFKPSRNTYFTESQPTEMGEETLPHLQGLNTAHIAPLRIFVDVVIDRSGEGISLGIRCDCGQYDVESVRRFAQSFVEGILRVERMLSALP